MFLRLLLLFAAATTATSAAMAQEESEPGALRRALLREDAELVLEGAPDQTCVQAMVRDHVLREVYLPERETHLSALEHRLWDSAFQRVRAALPELVESYQSCARELGARFERTRLQTSVDERLIELTALRVSVEHEHQRALRTGLRESCLDVSWAALRTRFSPPEPAAQPWRNLGMIGSTVSVAAGVFSFAMTFGRQAVGGSSLRLASLGLLLGSVGGLIVQGLWTAPDLTSARARIVVGGMSVLASIATGASLLAGERENRFRAMGGGLLASSFVNALVWAGALSVVRRARAGRLQLSAGMGGGMLGWAREF